MADNADDRPPADVLRDYYDWLDEHSPDEPESPPPTVPPADELERRRRITVGILCGHCNREFLIRATKILQAVRCSNCGKQLLAALPAKPLSVSPEERRRYAIAEYLRGIMPDEYRFRYFNDPISLDWLESPTFDTTHPEKKHAAMLKRWKERYPDTEIIETEPGVFDFYPGGREKWLAENAWAKDLEDKGF